MLDTICAYTNCFINYNFLSNNWTRTFSITSGELFYKCVYNIKLSYYPKRKLLRVEFSIPKLLYENNIDVYKPLDNTKLKIYNAIDIAMYPLTDHKIHDFIKWKVTRLDINHDYKCSSSNDALTYISALKKIQSIRAKYNDKFKTGVTNRCKSYSIVIYQKDKELITNIDKFKNIREFNKLLLKSNGVIRFEVQLKNHALKYETSNIDLNRTIDELLDPKNTIKLYKFIMTKY